MPNIKLIIAQHHDKVGGLYVAKGNQIAMAATNSLGGPKFLYWTVRGDHVFCHGQSGGTIFRGDQMKYDRTTSYLWTMDRTHAPKGQVPVQNRLQEWTED